jgi:hypothetical protein
MKSPEQDQSQPKSSDWTIPLVGGMAVLRVPTPLSKQNFDLIRTWFDSMKPALVPQNDEGKVPPR